MEQNVSHLHFDEVFLPLVWNLTESDSSHHTVFSEKFLAKVTTIKTEC